MRVLFYLNIFVALYTISGNNRALSIAVGVLQNAKLPSKCYGGDATESLKSGVNDMVIVTQSDGTLKSTPLQARVGKLSNWKTLFKSREGKEAKLYVNNIRALPEAHLILSDSGAVFVHRRRENPSCLFTNEEMQGMVIAGGINDAIIVVDELDIELSFKIYVYYQNDRLVITDIDGTITTSDIKGFLVGNVGVDVHHSGVVEFFNKVSFNGYKVVYLTARPLAFDTMTREYLFDTLQNVDGRLPNFIRYSLPKGPMIMSPISAKAAITADADVMKLETLKSLLNLFDIKHDVVAGAYGNKNTDTEAYLKSGIRGDRVFLINENSKLVNVATGNVSSYQLQAEGIDQYYPK